MQNQIKKQKIIHHDEPTNISIFTEDSISENCGVFGIYAPELVVGQVISLALVALQHRGQESCGIVTCDQSGTTHCHRGAGLVSQVFNNESVTKPLVGHMGIGHVRYSTAGGSNVENAQPVVVQTYHGNIALAQNGNLTTHKTLRQQLLKKGVGMFKDSDVEVITQLLAANPLTGSPEEPNWEARISSFMLQSEGAYSLCLMTKDAIFGCRDYLGMRPLCIGEIKLKNSKGKEFPRYVIASETCALTMVGASFVREVKPGEIVRIDENGLKSIVGRPPTTPAFCIFEYIYFARPDSMLENQLVLKVRHKLGEELARECPAEADIVIGVPESAVPAAVGFANVSKIPLVEGIIKNRYVHRTFIQPTHEMRQLGVSMKFTPLSENLQGKRVVLVDDSIVRGNTSKNLVKMLFKAGAKEIHLRVSSPPIRSPCFMGIDMATTDQMIAFNRTEEEICRIIGANSVKYLSHGGLLKAVREGAQPGGGYCGACFTGKYPLKVDDW